MKCCEKAKRKKSSGDLNARGRMPISKAKVIVKIK